MLERNRRVFVLDAAGVPEEGSGLLQRFTAGMSTKLAPSFLRFLRAVLVEFEAGGPADAVGVAKARCTWDPLHGDNWLFLAEALSDVGRREEADSVLDQGFLVAGPPGPALAMAVGVRALGPRARMGYAALADAVCLAPMTGRDDDARMDAAGLVKALGPEKTGKSASAQATDVLGPATAATATFWRTELCRALANGEEERAKLAEMVLRSLLPDDADTKRLTVSVGFRKGNGRWGPWSSRAMRWNWAMVTRAFDRPKRRLRAFQTWPCLMRFTEVLNGLRLRGGLEAAETATRLNSASLDGWREYGGCVA